VRVEKPKLHPQGKPLRLGLSAASADATLPAFLTRPPDAPVYYGFPLLEESRTDDGWCFGMISDPDCPEGRNWGDAFVVAPDNSRAGLIWHVGPPALEVSSEPGVDRWGVYTIGITREVHSRAELVEQLRAWLPELRRRHAVWAVRIAGHSTAAERRGAAVPEDHPAPREEGAVGHP
jgi:hypothetical protein